MSVSGAEIQRFKNQQAIYDCLLRCGRGIDRRDTELIESAFHNDATVDHGYFTGSASAFATFIGPFYDSHGVVQATHRVNQALIEFIDADEAHVESYSLVFIDAAGEGGSLTARTIGGRYLDRVERRDGAWAVAERTYVLDWNSNVDSTVDRDGSYFGELARGRTDRSDDSYALFAGLRP
jgi:hypothetical protein